jgi:hypothetical protein
VRTIEFERFLACARHALLETASVRDSTHPMDTEALQFYAALSQQCLVNEYIFDSNGREMLASVACREKLLTRLDSGEMVPAVLLLAVASATLNKKPRNWASRTLNMRRLTFSSLVTSRALSISLNRWESCIIWPSRLLDGTLLSRLRRGGFMGLGFYSEVVRRHIVRALDIIAKRGYASTPDDIRRFRQDPAVHANVELRSLSMSPDFHSTSECREMLFHVQEQRLTLNQIESFIAESGLQFIGFELDHRTLNHDRARFPDDGSGKNLRNRAHFEADHPDTFAGMCRFRIQKPRVH